LFYKTTQIISGSGCDAAMACLFQVGNEKKNVATTILDGAGTAATATLII
jgi:hypothetical protein